MKISCVSLLVFCATLALASSNPVPVVNQPLLPASIQPGSKAFTLTLNGTGFASGAVVKWNGTQVETEIISGSQAQAKISAADVAKAGTASVVLVNPAPGGGPSNIVYFPIRQSSKTVGLTRDNSLLQTGPLAVGDFNNDGNLDVVMQPYNGVIQIYLGNGDGTFKAPIKSSTSIDQPLHMVTADFNGDGNLDVLVFYGTSGKGAVFFGDGTGKLKEGPTFGAYHWIGVAVADLNHDGIPDLVQTGEITGFADNAVYLGNGDGTFTWKQDLDDGTGAPAIGDFNGDGNLDIALGGVTIYLGNGDGTFTEGNTYKAGGTSVAAADVNGDGKLDLVTDNFSVLLGNGDGTFNLGQTISLPYGDYENVNVGDFNGDGKLDAVVATQNINHTLSISVLLGNGDGTFQNPISLAAGIQKFSGANGFGMGDFNNDGKLDLALSGRKAFIALQSSVSVNPAQLTFANQNINTVSKPQTSTFTNLGSSALKINSIKITGTDAQDFAEKDNCGSSLPPNHSCKINVTFRPNATGQLQAAVAIDYEGSGSPSTIALTGTGVDLTVSLAPKKLDFATQLIGTESQQQTATLSNTGTQAVTISGIQVGGPFSQSNNCPSSLNPSKNCQIQVTFAPASKGDAHGTLSVSDNAVHGPQKTALAGTGTVVKFTPVSVNFGDQKNGHKSSPLPIRLTNEGTTALSISKIAISGSDAADFSQTNNCGHSVLANHSCTIKVTFDPHAKGQGSAKLQVSDDGGGSPQDVPLAGTGS